MNKKFGVIKLLSVCVAVLLVCTAAGCFGCAPEKVYTDEENFAEWKSGKIHAENYAGDFTYESRGLTELSNSETYEETKILESYSGEKYYYALKSFSQKYSGGEKTETSRDVEVVKQVDDNGAARTKYYTEKKQNASAAVVKQSVFVEPDYGKSLIKYKISDLLADYYINYGANVQTYADFVSHIQSAFEKDGIKPEVRTAHSESGVTLSVCYEYETLFNGEEQSEQVGQGDFIKILIRRECGATVYGGKITHFYQRVKKTFVAVDESENVTESRVFSTSVKYSFAAEIYEAASVEN